MTEIAYFTDLIDVDELLPLVDDPNCRVVDCRFELMDPARGLELYRQGHIRGAVFADLDKDLAAPISTGSGRHPLPDVEAFARRLRDWGISGASQVVAYDHGNGATAGRLWWMLRWLGHERVAVLNGGFAAWCAAGGSVDAEIPAYPRGDFAARPNAEMVATTEEILAAIRSGEGLALVDARDERRFRGEAEPIDSVAGRIPGAVNMPFQLNLDDSGRWRSNEEIAALWQRMERGGGSERPVAMCGSGVTACHLILAAQRIGKPLPRLYVGSWSAWISDPDRPIETG